MPDTDRTATVKRPRSQVNRFNWLKSLGMTQRGVAYCVHCRYCGRRGVFVLNKGYCTTGRVTNDPAHFYRSTMTMAVDHVVPLARGGTDDASNYAIACEDCNRRKGALTNWTAPNGAMVNGELVY